MRQDSDFYFTTGESDIPGMERVTISVGDDSATDQDVLTEIQTRGEYTTRQLIQLYEVSAGEWVAYFKI